MLPELAREFSPVDDSAQGELEAAFTPEELATTLGLDPDAVPMRLWVQALLGPARDFLSRPSKGFRGALADLAYVLAGGQGPAPAAPRLVVELVHAGSLIVDDVEDDGVLRRGQPALHRQVGVPLAINTGNWLYFWAQSHLRAPGIPAGQITAASRELQRTLLRCHHGQALDLATSVNHLEQHEVPGVVDATTRLKTGALIELAARLGARAADASPEMCLLLGDLGRELGVALQMLDDLGSLWSPARADKAWEDLRLRRPTWPWAWLATRLDRKTWQARVDALLLLDGAQGREAAGRLACAMLGDLGDSGRAQARAQLKRALVPVRTRLPGHPALRRLEQEIAKLEASYG